MRVVASIVLAVALAGVAVDTAAAQSICTTYANGTIYCQPQPGATAAADAQAAAQNAARGGYQSPYGNGGGVFGLLADFATIARRKKVGKLLAAGKCDEAIRTAQAAGDFELAAEAQNSCLPPPPPAEAPQQ